ncbi:MAG: SHOCT domain-containing protein [Sphingomonadales bacterium]|nr:SHOCT domain-containing protein [Sphingomonadales bacterium]MBD3771958.1 SHOCT domain-containing protein [Paracoccaceae bacterium]
MSTDDDLDRLERLARLRDSGALNAEEFEREKALLLQRDPSLSPTGGDAENPAQPAEESEAADRHRRRWPLLLIGGLALAGGGGWALAHWAGSAVQPAGPGEAGAATSAAHSTPAPAAGTTAPRSTIRSLPATRQVELAYAAVFGRGARDIAMPDDLVYSYDQGKVVWTDFGPVLLAEGTGNEPYPVALGTLGVFYLREVPGGKFEALRSWPDAIIGSIMANPPQWKVREDITDRPVVESSAGGVWQGYGCDATTLTELTPGGPKSLVTFDSHYDSSGAVEDGFETYDGVIANVVRNRSFDVRFTGTATIVQHFIRKGTGFVRVPAASEEMGESSIPTC